MQWKKQDKESVIHDLKLHVTHKILSCNFFSLKTIAEWHGKAQKRWKDSSRTGLVWSCNDLNWTRTCTSWASLSVYSGHFAWYSLEVKPTRLHSGRQSEATKKKSANVHVQTAFSTSWQRINVSVLSPGVLALDLADLQENLSKPNINLERLPVDSCCLCFSFYEFTDTSLHKRNKKTSTWTHRWLQKRTIHYQRTFWILMTFPFFCQAQPPSIWTILKIPDSASTLLSLFHASSQAWKKLTNKLMTCSTACELTAKSKRCGSWASWLSWTFGIQWLRAVRIQFHGFLTSTLKQCGSWQLEPPQGSVWKRRALNRCWVPPQVAPGVYCFLCEGSKRSKLE